MIRELLEKRELPELLRMNNGTPVTQENWEERRQEIIELFGQHVFGVMPKICGPTAWEEIVKDHDAEDTACGIAYTRQVQITFPTPDGKSFTFPIRVTVPYGASASQPKAAFVLISFGQYKYYPLEELAEQDVIVAEMIMNDVAPDAEDHYANGMSPHYFKDGKRTPNGFGKIGMWAFAASRVLDYLLAQDYVDASRVGVIGHSRLGKTALWAGANDTRFTHIFANESGCMGASITRKKVGETCPVIYRFPFWFCENMAEMASSVEASESVPFDQHFLIAASAPRKVYVSSAEEDQWADPVSEYLGCAAASPAWEIHGMTGFVYEERLPEGWDEFHEGNIWYHQRPGTHFLSRHDWVRFCKFLKAF